MGDLTGNRDLVALFTAGSMVESLVKVPCFTSLGGSAGLSTFSGLLLGGLGAPLAAEVRGFRGGFLLALFFGLPPGDDEVLGMDDARFCDLGDAPRCLNADALVGLTAGVIDVDLAPAGEGVVDLAPRLLAAGEVYKAFLRPRIPLGLPSGSFSLGFTILGPAAFSSSLLSLSLEIRLRVSHSKSSVQDSLAGSCKAFITTFASLCSAAISSSPSSDVLSGDDTCVTGLSIVWVRYRSLSSNLFCFAVLIARASGSFAAAISSGDSTGLMVWVRKRSLSSKRRCLGVLLDSF
ncbi:hypothetical protein B566_EDAN013729 [Ephemera danica]|nr:hypothetical protein B566_EDAN013729 [Ephemera danica]